MAQLKAVHRITFADMIKEPEVYKGLSDGLVQLPLPDKIKNKTQALSRTTVSRRIYAVDMLRAANIFLILKKKTIME